MRRGRSEYDGYAVGRRVLKVAPGWLLLCLAGFVLVFLFFGWMSRPIGKRGQPSADGARKNEATNETVASSPDARPAAQASKPSPTAPARAETGQAEVAGAENTSATPNTPQAGSVEDGALFTIQVGSFDEPSQANEKVSALRAAGFEARVVESETARRVWYQVQCGRFLTREEAARFGAQLRARRLAAETIIAELTRQ